MKISLIHQLSLGAVKNDIKSSPKDRDMMTPSVVASMGTFRVRVKVRRSLPRIDLVATELGPLESGSTVELERWQAEVLARHGVVEWPLDSRSLLTEAYSRRDLEQESRALRPEGNPIWIIPDIVEAMRREGVLEQKVEAIRSLLEDLVSIRLNKIIRMARLGQNDLRPLGDEERWLYSSLVAIFEKWREDTESLLDLEG